MYTFDGVFKHLGNHHVVTLSKIDNVHAHPNAERLELAEIKGWQCVIPKGRYKDGSLVVYAPPDSVLPVELSGVTKYLSNGRVRCARLRGEPSFGVIFDRDDEAWPEGLDVADRYGITKYVPPIKTTSGDAEVAHPLFESYTEIENMRNFPNVLVDGEEVVVTEKIHGTNCRIGMIEGQWMAGSKGMRRKMPPEEKLATNLYWNPYSIAGVRSLIESIGAKQAILFGEVYGRVKSLRYGLQNGIAFRAFDLLVDGRYIGYEAFRAMCFDHEIEVAPVLYRGPFDMIAVKNLSQGSSIIPGADNIREGVVVKPKIERRDPTIGRVILKYISDEYLLGNQTETEEQ